MESELKSLIEKSRNQSLDHAEALLERVMAETGNNYAIWVPAMLMTIARISREKGLPFSEYKEKVMRTLEVQKKMFPDEAKDG